MTKKDYIRLANVIKNARKQCDCDPAMVDAINVIMEKLSAALQEENERFKPEVFRKACY